MMTYDKPITKDKGKLVIPNDILDATSSDAIPYQELLNTEIPKQTIDESTNN